MGSCAPQRSGRSTCSAKDANALLRTFPNGLQQLVTLDGDIEVRITDDAAANASSETPVLLRHVEGRRSWRHGAACQVIRRWYGDLCQRGPDAVLLPRAAKHERSHLHTAWPRDDEVALRPR